MHKKILILVIILSLIILPFSIYQVNAEDDETNKPEKGDIRCPEDAGSKCVENKDASGKVTSVEVTESQDDITITKIVSKTSTTGEVSVKFKVTGEGEMMPEKAWVVFVFDVSNSLSKSTTFEKAKKAIAKFSRGLDGSYVALVEFAGKRASFGNLNKFMLMGSGNVGCGSEYITKGCGKYFKETYSEYQKLIGQNSRLEKGLSKAYGLLSKKAPEDAKKFLVVFGDGEYYYKDYTTWGGDDGVSHYINAIKKLPKIYTYDVRYPSQYESNHDITASKTNNLFNKAKCKANERTECNQKVMKYLFVNNYENKNWESAMETVAKSIENELDKVAYSGEITDTFGSDFSIQKDDEVIKEQVITLETLNTETTPFTINIDNEASTGWHETNDGFKLTYQKGKEIKTITSYINPEMYWEGDGKTKFDSCHDALTYNDEASWSTSRTDPDTISHTFYQLSCEEKLDLDVNIHEQEIGTRSFDLKDGLGVTTTSEYKSNMVCKYEFDKELYDSELDRSQERIDWFEAQEMMYKEKANSMESSNAYSNRTDYTARIAEITRAELNPALAVQREKEAAYDKATTEKNTAQSNLLAMETQRDNAAANSASYQKAMDKADSDYSNCSICGSYQTCGSKESCVSACGSKSSCGTTSSCTKCEMVDSDVCGSCMRYMKTRRCTDDQACIDSVNDCQSANAAVDSCRTAYSMCRANNSAVDRCESHNSSVEACENAIPSCQSNAKSRYNSASINKAAADSSYNEAIAAIPGLESTLAEKNAAYEKALAEYDEATAKVNIIQERISYYQQANHNKTWKELWQNYKKNIENMYSDYMSKVLPNFPTSPSRVVGADQLFDYVDRIKNNFPIFSVVYDDNEESTVNTSSYFQNENVSSINKVGECELSNDNHNKKCDITFTRSVNLKPKCMSMRKAEVEECISGSELQIKAGNKYYLERDVTGAHIGITYSKLGLDSNLDISMDSSESSGVCYADVYKTELTYRQIDLSDPFLQGQRYRSINKREIGINFSNSKFNFINAFDASLWSSGKTPDYDYKLSKVNIENIRNDTASSTIESYLGTNCKINKATNIYICPFTRGNTNAGMNYFFSDAKY